MSKDNIRIKGLADVRLRSDGQELWLTFQTSHNKKITLVVPGSEMRDLSYQLMMFDRQAQIKRGIPPDPDRPKLTIDAPPAMFVVTGLQGVSRPDTGYLDLQVQDVMNHEIQLSIAPEHVKYIFEMRLQTQKLDDQKPN